MKSKSNKHYDWEVMPDAYLASALLICDALLLQSAFVPDQTQEIFGNDVFNKLSFRSSHPDYELIRPLVFNMKHAIELYIKMLGAIDYGEYETKHDLKYLFELALKNAKANQNYQALEKLCENTWPIIEKYYYGFYITGNKSKAHPDKKNIAEKYPEYRRAYKFSLLHLSRVLIEEIKQDVQKLEKYFSQVKRDIKPSKKFYYGKTRKNPTT